MAAVTILGAGLFSTSTGTKSYSATPAVGDLIILVVANTGYTGTVIPTDNNSDGLGTYTLINSAVKVTSADTMQVYVRNSLIGSASATSFSHAPGTTTGGIIIAFKVTGMSSAGIGVIRQSAVQSNQASGTPTPVFSNTTLASNPIIGFVFNGASPATLTPRTNFTERIDSGYLTPTTGMEVMSRDSGETSTSIAWGSSSASAFCSIVVEIQVNTPPTVVLNSPADTATGISTTPELDSTGTDANSDDVKYEVQVDTVNTFDSQGSSPAFVQSASPGTNAAGATATTATGAFASTNTAGNAIIVGAVLDNETSTTSVTDTAGNVYTLQAKYPTFGNRYLEVWACFSILSFSSNVVTLNQAFTDSAVFAHEYSGLSGVIDQTISAINTNASPTATTATTTMGKELVLSLMEMDVFSSDSINSAGTGYSNFQTGSSNNVLGAIESKVVTTIGAQTAAFNVTNAGGASWRQLVITFLGSATPLLDKVSGTDAGFSDTANVAINDAFNQNTLNGSLWTQTTGGSATMGYSSTGVTVTYPASSTSSTLGQIASNTTYDFTGKFATLKVTTMPSATTSADAEFRLQKDASNWVRWIYEGGTLFAQQFVAASRNNLTSFAYSATTHKYLRIRESGGTTFWDTSPDGITWTNRTSATNPITVTALSVMILGSCFQAETNPGTFVFLLFNQPGAFTSGNKVAYTVQPADTLSTTTYYWRVRGGDPAGTNTYGVWPATRSFTVGGVVTVTIIPQRMLQGIGL